jgi:hypothetical protein
MADYEQAKRMNWTKIIVGGLTFIVNDPCRQSPRNQKGTTTSFLWPRRQSWFERKLITKPNETMNELMHENKCEHE